MTGSCDREHWRRQAGEGHLPNRSYCSLCPFWNPGNDRRSSGPARSGAWYPSSHPTSCLVLFMKQHPEPLSSSEWCTQGPPGDNSDRDRWTSVGRLCPQAKIVSRLQPGRSGTQDSATGSREPESHCLWTLSTEGLLLGRGLPRA